MTFLFCAFQFPPLVYSLLLWLFLCKECKTPAYGCKCLAHMMPTWFLWLSELPHCPERKGQKMTAEEQNKEKKEMAIEGIYSQVNNMGRQERAEFLLCSLSLRAVVSLTLNLNITSLHTCFVCVSVCISSLSSCQLFPEFFASFLSRATQRNLCYHANRSKH